MDETSVRVLFLVVGAVLSFIPQEISRWLQARRDTARESAREQRELDKEKRLIKQQREERIWQLEQERFARVESVISKTARHQFVGGIEYDTELIAELFYLKTTLMRHPKVNSAFDEYFRAEMQLTEAKKVSYIDEDSRKEAVDNAEVVQSDAVKHLLFALDDHLARSAQP